MTMSLVVTFVVIIVVLFLAFALNFIGYMFFTALREGRKTGSYDYTMIAMSIIGAIAIILIEAFVAYCYCQF